MSVNFILRKFNKVKNKQNIIYYTYILFSKTRNLQENIDWSSVKEENVPIFVPPITFGKVLKIYTGDTFVLATKLPFFHETIETAPICKFTIHLDGVSAPIDKENGSITKEILIQKIEHQIVQLRDVSTDRHGKIYAKVFLAEENVNEWLLKNQYVVKSQNGKKRRMSESDSILSNPSLPSIKHYSCKDIIPENANTNTLTIDNFVLPFIQRQNTNLSTSSGSVKTDCFLSHNWGDQNKNHNFVKKVNMELQKRGLKTWFDETQMDGNIRFRMAEGIDNTKCVVVFITKEYRDKVNGIDMTDNCKYEFSYAMNQLGSQNMIPVILETEMRDTKKWKGELGAALGSMMYVDLFDMNDTMLELKYEDISRRIRKIVDREKRKSNKL